MIKPYRARVLEIEPNATGRQTPTGFYVYDRDGTPIGFDRRSSLIAWRDALMTLTGSIIIDPPAR